MASMGVRQWSLRNVIKRGTKLRFQACRQAQTSLAEFDTKRESFVEVNLPIRISLTAPFGGMARDKTAGPDSGPEPPFPIRLNGRIVKGFGRGSKEVRRLCPLPRNREALNTIPHRAHVWVMLTCACIVRHSHSQHSY